MYDYYDKWIAQESNYTYPKQAFFIVDTLQECLDYIGRHPEVKGWSLNKVDEDKES